MRSVSYSESHNPLLANEEKWDDEEDDEEEEEEEQLQQHERRGRGGLVGGGSDEEGTGELNMIGVLDKNQFYTSSKPPPSPHNLSAPSLAE